MLQVAQESPSILQENGGRLDDSIPSPIPDIALQPLQSVTPSARNPTETSAVRPIKRRKKADVQAIEKKKESFLDVATGVLSNQNEYTAFGNSVSYQLKDMEHYQRVIAEKLISDILFHGKLGNLKGNSAVTVEPDQNKNLNSFPNQWNHPSHFVPQHQQPNYSFQQTSVSHHRPRSPYQFQPTPQFPQISAPYLGPQFPSPRVETQVNARYNTGNQTDQFIPVTNMSTVTTSVSTPSFPNPTQSSDVTNIDEELLLNL